MRVTITEALAEIKLITKKHLSKREVVNNNLVYLKPGKDPFESEGGAKAYLAKEIQSIKDLEKRSVKIRGEIAKSNTNTSLTINETTMSVYDWITWKREVAQEEFKFYNTIQQNVKRQVDEHSKRPSVYKDEKEQTQLMIIEANVDYSEFIKKAEQTQSLMEQLDGKLSLNNATTTIEI